jgi:hypothetical protein
MSLVARPVRRSLTALAGLVVLVTLLAPALPASASKTTTTTASPASRCGATQLSISDGGNVAAVSGEDGFLLTFTNTSATFCTVKGYPSMRFYDRAGTLLTFRYTRASQYFRQQSPRLVGLAPRAHAYAIVAKSGCVLGNRYVSTFFYVIDPNTLGPPWVGHESGAAGAIHFAYCKGPAKGAGQDVGVSVIAASRAALLP